MTTAYLCDGIPSRTRASDDAPVGASSPVIGIGQGAALSFERV